MENKIELKKASRKQVKLRVGMSAVSGGGKTTSALLMAFGITGDWSKIAVIDTENESASLYENYILPDGFVIGEFQTVPLSPPFSPERYIECIKACENGGIEVCIIDSITHEWDGKGGILDISNSMVGNSYTNWAKITPRHDAFINAILQSKMHMITCVRRKQDYELVTNSQGKLMPQKVGLKEITREGFEYELTLNFNIEINHMATASKDRTGLFMDKPEFKITSATGKQLLEWCNSGEKVKTIWEKYMNLVAGSGLPSIEQDSYLKDLKGVSYLDWDGAKITKAYAALQEVLNKQSD